MREVQLFEQVQRARAVIGALLCHVRQHHVFHDRHIKGVALLRHIADVAPAYAAEIDFALRFQGSRECLYERGFAAPVAPDDGVNRGGLQRQLLYIEDRAVAVGLFRGDFNHISF